MAGRQPLEVQIHSVLRPLPLRPVIRRALGAAARTEAVASGSSVGVLVCDDVTIRDYNRRFAGEDSATDVLAFPSDADRELGDIVLSIDHMRAQARAAGHPVEVEAATLAIHGFLHLLGYDHANRRDQAVMFGRTDKILARAGLTAGSKPGRRPR
ncbi:MAG: rRNA maturation RNase YbeY [Candidatus Dormiibacterota bacterium]